MDSNKRVDELFQQMKKVYRTAKARQDSLAKLQARVQKKKKLHLTPTFISLAMLAIATVLFLTYNTNDSQHLEGQSGINTQNEINEQTIQYVLKQEFSGPNEQFIRLKTNPATTLAEQNDDSAAENAETIYLQEFLKNTYEPHFTESGFENFIPYAFFYHLGDENSTYQISLDSVDIEQNDADPSRYTIDFTVNFKNSMGNTQKLAMTGAAAFAEEGKLQDITFEDSAGLIVTILENI